MKFSKNYLIILICIILICFFVGCTSTRVVNNSLQDDETITDTTLDSSEEDTHTEEFGDSEEDAFAKNLLKDIKNLAQQGKVVKGDFEVKNTNFTSIEKEWGDADSTSYVADAKGTYSTYDVQRMVFGWNKGMQIFEVRSFDEDLKEITYGLLRENYGEPEYSVEKDEEKILGYRAGEEFKILFVFKVQEDMSTAKLDHYSVLYSAGTVNSMANDPGREW